MDWPYLTAPSNSSTSNPSQWFVDYVRGGGTSDSGVAVNAFSAMTFSPWWEAVTMIAHDVASMPLKIYERLPNNDREIDYKHPAWWLLNEEPNPLMTADVFRETLQSHALNYGNGYAAIYRTNRGDARELIPLFPDRTSCQVLNGELVYTTRYENGETDTFNRRDVLHVKGLGFDGLTGYSVIRMARNAIGLGLVEERHGNSTFKNNARPSVVLKVPGKIDREKANELLDMWEQRHGGENRGRPALASGGMEIGTLTGQNNADAEWLKSRSFQREEVAAFFRMPVHKLGSEKRSSYNSLEIEERAYLNQTLRIWLKKWENECKCKLLAMKERKRRTRFIEHDVTHLIESDSATLNKVLSQQLHDEVISPNEYRRKINLNKRPDGGGDVYQNPNTKSAESQATEPTEPNTEPMEAVYRMVANEAKKVFGIEQERVNKAAKSEDNFIDWIETFYATWPNTICNRLRNSVQCVNEITTSSVTPESIAGELANQSKAALITVSGYSYPDTLVENVKTCVADWTETRSNHVISLLKGPS